MNQEQEKWEKEFDEKYQSFQLCETIRKPDFDRLKTFLRHAIQTAREEERQFILNTLDGIDIADKEMGKVGGGTLAIRQALISRITK